MLCGAKYFENKTIGSGVHARLWSRIRHRRRSVILAVAVLLAVDICSLTLFPFVSLVEPEAYPGIRSDFDRSFENLRSLPTDLLLGSHADFFDMHRKQRAQLTATDSAAPFIDNAGNLAFIDRAESRFRAVLAKQQQ